MIIETLLLSSLAVVLPVFGGLLIYLLGEMALDIASELDKKKEPTVDKAKEYFNV